MTAKLLEGKPIAAKIEEDLRKELDRLEAKYGKLPRLVAIKSCSDESAGLYLKSQKKLAERLNIRFEILDLSCEASEDSFVKTVRDLNRDDDVNGIFILMPLPKSVDPKKVNAEITAKKDVEGIRSENLGLLVLKQEKILPCTALSSLELIESTGVDLYGKEAVIVGASKVIGCPLALLLIHKMATTTVCHIGTAEKGDLKAHVERAEILVAAVGRANIIPGDWVKKGAIVIDVGINRVDGKTVGDVEFEAASKRASYITPVPGGVGPLTVMFLMKNLATAFKWQKGEI